MLTISIAMATYNGANFIGEQLDSFAAQTRWPEELVICDDGSTDNTATIVAKFAVSAPFAVRFIRNEERLGYNRNFAKSIDLCSGELIFVSDQDDKWFTDKIATVANLFDAPSPPLCVVNDQIIASPDGMPSGTTVLGNVRRLGYRDSFYGPGCCTAINRMLLEVIIPFPGDVVAYDHWLNIFPSLLGAQALYERPLQLYRRHHDNTSNSTFAQRRPGLFALAVAAQAGDARQKFTEKVRELDAIAARLDERRNAIDALGLGDRLDNAIKKVATDRSDYALRLTGLGHSRLLRVAFIAGLWRRGVYGRFGGMRTALKDLVT